jgi:hypothetical protein
MYHALHRLRLPSYTTVRNYSFVVDRRTRQEFIEPCYPVELKVCSATLCFIDVMVGLLLCDFFLNCDPEFLASDMNQQGPFEPEPKTIKLGSYDNSDSSSFYFTPLCRLKSHH